MSLFRRMMQNASDRLAYGFGSQAAAGRLNLGAATAEIRSKWNQYAGRKGIRSPVARDVAQFLAFQYGLPMSDEDVARLLGRPTPRGVLDMDDVLPRLADVLMDNGTIVVERA
jgi:hypothetical protein